MPLHFSPLRAPPRDAARHFASRRRQDNRQRHALVPGFHGCLMAYWPRRSLAESRGLKAILQALRVAFGPGHDISAPHASLTDAASITANRDGARHYADRVSISSPALPRIIGLAQHDATTPRLKPLGKSCQESSAPAITIVMAAPIITSKLPSRIEAASQ